MNRRELLRLIPAAAAASAARGADTFPSPQGRLRGALCAYSYRDQLAKKTLRYEDMVRLSVENEVDGIDMTVYWMPPDPGDDFLLPLRRVAYRNGVEIYSIAIRTDMCRPTKELQDQEVETVRKWVQVAKKLGAGHIRVFGGAIPKGATEDQAAGWASEVMKRAVDIASKQGVILGIENHGGITEKAERILQIVKSVDSPWAGINLDTGNFRANVWQQTEMCIPYAVNVQVKVEVMQEDGKRGPGDWDRVCKLLVKGGYKGYLALEYEGKDAPGEVPGLLKKLGTLTRKYSA